MSALPERLVVEAWEDAVVERLGFDPRGPYLEQVWLGRIGPASTLIMRRLAGGLQVCPEGYEIDTAELAAEMGLGSGNGPNSRLAHALERLWHFGLARPSGPEGLQVRRMVPPLTTAQLHHLGPSAHRAHELLVARRVATRQLGNGSEAAIAASRARGRAEVLGALEQGLSR